MRALIQRVTRASVTIVEEPQGVPTGDQTSAEGSASAGDVRSIGAGYVVLLGVGQHDTVQDAEKLWRKIFRLRLFADDAGKTNLSLADVGGDVLIVSQFTLYASCKKGTRPSFTQAGAPDQAERLYQYFVELARADVAHVQTGEFGAHMEVALVNDGPFTIWLDTDES
jgi:D-tyrosyl-tRNA(Tyr) deacylase